MAKLRWTKNPHGTQVLETRVPVDHLLPSFFFFSPFFFLFFFFFLHMLSQDNSSSPNSSSFFFSFLKHPNPFLKIPNPKITISKLEQKPKPKNHDLGTRAPWVWRSQHQSGLGLLISAPKVRFLVWFVSWFVLCVLWVGLLVFSGLMFWVFFFSGWDVCVLWVVVLCCFGFLFFALVSVEFSRLLHFLGCCIMWFLDWCSLRFLEGTWVMEIESLKLDLPQWTQV